MFKAVKITIQSVTPNPDGWYIKAEANSQIEGIPHWCSWARITNKRLIKDFFQHEDNQIEFMLKHDLFDSNINPQQQEEWLIHCSTEQTASVQLSKDLEVYELGDLKVTKDLILKGTKLRVKTQYEKALQVEYKGGLVWIPMVIEDKATYEEI